MYSKYVTVKVKVAPPVAYVGGEVQQQKYITNPISTSALKGVGVQY